MVNAIEENGVRVMVDFHNRWSPPFNAAYTAVRAGELGELYSGYFRLNDIKWWLLICCLGRLSLQFYGFWEATASTPCGGYLARGGASLLCQPFRRPEGTGGGHCGRISHYAEFKNGAIAHMENGWITPMQTRVSTTSSAICWARRGMIAIDASNHNLIQKYTDEKVEVPDVIVQNHIFGQPKGLCL